MTAAEGKPTGSLRLLPTAALLIGAALAYGAVAFNVLFNGHTWTDEVTYLVKSWWYTSGAVEPYTATDATWYMPLYFYQLGFWQHLEGIGHIAGRLMSIGLGVVNGALLFIICRRLTANTPVAAAAVFILLGTPATAFYFATATPAATVSALHLAAIWLIVANMGRQRPWASVLMGLLCVALYFYRQNMILGIVVLVPLYIAAIGRKRLAHSALVLATIAGATAAIVLSFPDKLGYYALRLPVISPMLESLGLLSPNFTLIDKGTISPYSMGPAFDRLAPADIFDAFLLPYAGTIALALLLLVVVKGPLRILWIAPLYFFWLAASHYLGSAGYCGRCILSYTPYFIGIGALAGALTLAMLAHWARRNQLPPEPFVLVGALVAVGLNAFAPAAALQKDYQSFPVPLMVQERPQTELAEIETMARWIKTNAPAQEPILVIHSLGSQTLASLPYAVFLSEHMMPAQSLNLAQSKRTINPKLSGNAREAVQAAIEEESLWTDETMQRWIARDYDWVLFQEDKGADQRAQLAAITARFDLAATTGYRGWNIFLYKRKPVQ